MEAAGKQAGKRGRTVTGAPRKEISDKDIQKEIKETLARLSKGKKTQASAKTRRAKRDAKAERAEREQLAQMEAAHTLELTEFVTASELATMMDISVNEVISACMSLGDGLHQPAPRQGNHRHHRRGIRLRCGLRLR